MTSIADCIQRAVDARALNPAHGRAALAEFEQLRARYETIMPPAQAAASAAADLKEATRKAARSRRHKVLNELQAMRRLKSLVETSDDPGRVLRDLIEGHTRDGFTGESVRGLTEAMVDSINAGLFEVLQKHGLNVAGSVSDRAGFANLIRELHGQKTGDATAAQLADAVRYQQRRMRQLFNAHGGDVGELADYGVAHAHSSAMLQKHGFAKWAADISPRLAWHKITDLTTGKPFVATPGAAPNAAAARRFLEDVYKGITTSGWDDRAPSMRTGGSALYNQRADHRVLHFASGDDWMAYNATYGHSDPFSAMLSGLHGLARDVAMMRVLGPNPLAALEFAIQVATKRAAVAGDAKMAARVRAQGALAKTMLAHTDGTANVPEHLATAAFFSGTRSVLASIQLGSAVLVSVTDAATLRLTEPYDASCIDGRSDYVDSGNAACEAGNGITEGRFAEWVAAEHLSQARPADPAAGATGSEALIAGSDDFARYRMAFARAAEALIADGRCGEADFREMGGWMKSVNGHPNQPVYFTYCGGATVANRLYLNAETGEIFR